MGHPNTARFLTVAQPAEKQVTTSAGVLATITVRTHPRDGQSLWSSEPRLHHTLVGSPSSPNGCKLGQNSLSFCWLFYNSKDNSSNYLPLLMSFLSGYKSIFHLCVCIYTHILFFLATPHSLQDLSSPTRRQTRAPAVKMLSPNCWSTREFTHIFYL